eukprot:TRINITY_DN16055_c0_g1_i1.p1 TRINITY_DN16055_c0_g1~~TRINITY_DN16055_c0_g1_i1.p1  ORF type:complete len:113 (+),score=22.62 TRINITY_DN16055_c0_g1_i1:1-339(+)
MTWFRTGCFSCALAVTLGAFGAHGLKKHVEPAMLEVWSTSVNYHFIHAFGMILNALAPRTSERAGLAFLIGSCLFSGSLYALVLSQKKWLGAITPFGGLSFIAGWVLLALDN